MPMEITLNLPTTEPAPAFLTLESQKRGVITLIDKSRLPKDALEEAINLFLYEDGNAGPRPGVDWYGAAMPNGEPIDGVDYFDYDGVIHLVAAAGGVVYRSTDNGDTWIACTGASYTADNDLNMNQNGGYLYMTDGIDDTIRYNGTLALQTYTALSSPAAPTLNKTGLASTTYTYYIKASAVNEVGYTEASSASSVQVSLTQDSWDATSNFVTASGTVSTNARRVDLYLSDNNIDFYYIGSSVVNSGTGAYSLKIDNTSIPIPSTLAPTVNTTEGEKYEELVNVGDRQFGIRNTENRYRIGYTGSGVNAGSFAPGLDAGSIDWQTGGKFIPVQVADYRDGRGTPVATIWCDSADGQGCILQMTLDTVTYGDVQVIIPSIYKLPGSRGTPAPGSVINVLNDYYFYNGQAIYNIGNRANLQQILSTDEMSANVRPTIKQVSTSAESGIATTYFDARIYFSVPYGSTTNSGTIIYDTERRAWLPDAFDIGFKKFLKYTSTSTDGTKTQRLLCLKPGDNRLSEISTSIQGDYGVPFTTSLKTGLYPVSRNRFEFQWTEEAEIELSNPQGTINIELIGIERSRGFRSTNSEQITSRLSSTGHSTYLHSSRGHSDTSDAVDTFSESSIKRYFPVQKELNAVQWSITTNTLNAHYIMRTMQTWGTETLAGKPRSWKI